MTATAEAPEPASASEPGDETGADFRRIMVYLTDKLWALGMNELAMAILHDIVEDAEIRQETAQNDHERLSDS
jgi:hypothetical protein